MKTFLKFSLIALFCFGFYLLWVDPKKIAVQKQGHLDQILHLIADNYVDPLDLRSLEKSALDGVFSHLDPHSVYLNAQAVQERNQDLSGSFSGLGVRYAIIRNSLVITGVLPNSPAAKAGLEKADRIVKVNHKTIENPSVEKVKTWFKTYQNASVDLTVFRKSLDQNLTLSIKPDEIKVPSVDTYYLLRPDLGYLRLTIFGDACYEELVNAVDHLQSEGAKKIILDLRDNGGGYLKEVLQIAEEFLPSNRLLLYTEGKHQPRQDYYTFRSGLFEDLPLAILVNQNSASASEILSGGLQDQDRAVLIGRRTFGKGLVQQPFEGPNGSEIVLTIAKYFMPSGRCVQKPYRAQNKEQYYKNDWTTRLKSGELTDKNKIPHDETQIYHTLNGRKVYGGGGVIPDLFVPIEVKNPADAFIDTLLNRQVLSNFAFLHAENLNFQLPYQNFKQIEQNLQIEDQTFKDFLQFTQTENIHMPLQLTDQQIKKVKNWLKAFTLFHIYQDQNFYFDQFLASTDPMIQKAIESFDHYQALLKPNL